MLEREEELRQICGCWGRDERADDLLESCERLTSDIRRESGGRLANAGVRIVEHRGQRLRDGWIRGPPQPRCQDESSAAPMLWRVTLDDPRQKVELACLDRDESDKPRPVLAKSRSDVRHISSASGIARAASLT